ncbi:Tetraspanin-11 [Holothuria leucospilota]|uniref:Tetraspanin-11 n=1 Tax=Holothuria leucospilota TaxID=206669 RepID=A0A9Q0YKI7_HOLLE|nr:Tetraspanin-11 [Holothuria leucospilota]
MGVFLTGGVTVWTWVEVNKLPARNGILLVMGPLFFACMVTPVGECFVALIGVFFGLYGIHFKKRGFLFLQFSFVLVSALAAFIFAVITIFSSFMTDGITDAIEIYIDNSYGVYGRDDITTDIDLLQTGLTCCGSVSFNSWSDSEWLNLEKLARFDGEVVPSIPPSCCVFYPNSTGNIQQYINIQACQGITQSIPNEFMHQTGCSDDVIDNILPFVVVIACSQVWLFVMEIFVIINSIVVLQHIRASDPPEIKESEYIAKLYNSMYQKYGGNVVLNIQKGTAKKIRVDSPSAFENLVYTDMYDSNLPIATSRL